MTIGEVWEIFIVVIFGFLLVSPIFIVGYEYVRDKGWRTDTHEI